MSLSRTARRLRDACLRAGVFSFFLATSLFVASPALAPAQTAPANGTPIPNTAHVAYQVEGGEERGAASNQVVALVSGSFDPGEEPPPPPPPDGEPVTEFSLTTDATYLVERNQVVQLPHLLTNLSDFADDFLLTLGNAESGGDFDVLDLQVFHDLNGNGIVDTGEPRIPDGGILTLDAGAAAHLLIRGTIPALVGDGALAFVNLNASSRLTGGVIQNTDTLTATAPVLNLQKTASAATLEPGDTLLFNIRGGNTGGPAPTLEVTLDGVARQAVLVRDPIPANTVFATFGATGAALPVYHLFGAPLHSYVSAPPNDLTQVDAVAFIFDRLGTGATFDLNFGVRINANAAGTIRNTARLIIRDSTLAASADSNLAITDLPDRPPTFVFYRDGNFNDTTNAITLGSDLHADVDAAQCNTDSSAVEIVSIIVESALSGDVETYLAVETSPNSGVFRIAAAPTADANTVSLVLNNGTLEVVSRDTLTATVEGCGVTTQADVIIDPAGFVFNPLTCEPLPNVVVTLIDVTGAGNGGRPGEPAVVFQADGITPSPNPYVTDENGFYEFPLVAPSIYRFEVDAGEGAFFPSPLAADFCAEDRELKQGTNGEDFPVDLTTGAVFIDISVFVPFNGSFGLEKKASRDTAEPGDSVVYELTAKIDANFALNDAVIDDSLPRGFRYIPGSTRLNDQPAPDPEGGLGPNLRFPVGRVRVGEQVRITYATRVERGTPPGNAINTAIMRNRGALPLDSNPATALVRIVEGVLSDRGVIVGKAFVDENLNRQQDPGEPGVPGIRVYLEDGTYAISDNEGAYSFYGVRPKTHVLKLDRDSLPVGARVPELDSRNAGDGDSRFVDLQRGEIHKADFILAPDPEVMAQVLERREAAAEGPGEIEQALRRRLDKDYRERELADTRALPATGVVGAGQGGAANAETAATGSARSSFTSLLPRDTLNAGNSNLPAAPVLETGRLPLETWVERAQGNAPGFIGLANGSTVPGRQTDLRIKGPLGSVFEVILNGTPLGADRVAKRVVSVANQIEAWELLGIDLAPGTNRLELVVRDPFGNERHRDAIDVIAPDQLARIELAFSNPEPTADGRTPVTVTVALIDQAGTAISARTPITLESTLGEWRGEDLDPVEPGLQVFLSGGRGSFELAPPDVPGDARLVVSSGAIREEVMLPFLPELRPMIASGILEGTVVFKSGGTVQLGPVSAADAFQEELSELSASDDLRAGGRAAFFLKGKIKGNLLLTAAYDSDKRTRERLFRDIEPDRYYPVYGDASIRGYDAQSSRRFYLRVDHKRSYLLVGDFETRFDGEQRGLGNYTRSLNGVRAHYETNRVVANAFASEDTTRRVVEELPADGTSGPYQFRATNGLVNSERVEILTRDRSQLSNILETEVMQRFVDYDFEPFTGRLLFRAPVRSLDSNLNPRFIRITYEVDQGGNPFWVYGADAQVRVSDRLEVGGSAVRDENPLDRQSLYSANATVRLGESTYVLGEVAASETDLRGSGLAGRIDLRHHAVNTDVRVFYGQTENSFENPGALLTPGRVEAGAKLSRRLDDNDRIVAQAIDTEDTRDAGGSLRGVRVDWEHTFANRMKVEFGARYSKEEGLATGISTRPGGAAPLTPGASPNPTVLAPFEVTSVRAKLTTPVPHVADASLFAEYEQDIVESGQRMAALGGEWQFSNQGKVYARHEFISSLGGPFELNTLHQNNVTLFGIETSFLRDTKFFNEYRARNAFTGREAEASTGLRNEFQLAPGLRLQASVERVTPFDGTVQNESTAITTGLEYTDNPDWKGTARIETRLANQNDTYLNTLGYARKLSRDWTFLAKSIYYQVIDQSGQRPDSLQARILAGVAWRQTQTNQWNALARYEYRYEDGLPLDSSLEVNRHVHILSAHVNYQPDADWIISGRYGLKFVDEQFTGFATDYTGHQLSLRALRDLGKRWDAGLGVSYGWSHGGDRSDWAIGPEIGYSFARNLRVGVGYNVVGFTDADLAADIPTQRGLFLNLRLKFDEGFGPLRWLADSNDPVHRREDEEEHHAWK